jgi:hypothetical protein
MAEYRDWGVSLIVTAEHYYTVRARTPEQAITEAEGRLDEGDEGEIIGLNVESADAACEGVEYTTLEEDDIEPQRTTGH